MNRFVCLAASLLFPVFTAYAPLAAQEDLVFVLDTLRVDVDSRAHASFPVSTRTVEVIGRSQIALLPASTVADVLRWSNAVELLQRSGAQSDVSIRGAGFEQILVFVDGIRVSDAQSGHFDFDLTVPLDRIERVEILRGAASALYGADAVGGVVNVVTRGGRSGWHGRLEGGSFGEGRAALTGALTTGDVSAAGGVEYARSDGHRDGADFETYQGQGAVTFPLVGGSTRLEGGYAHRDFGAGDFYAPIDAFERTRTTRASASWDSPDLGGVGVESRFFLRRHHDEFVFFRDEPERGANVHDGSQLGAEVTVRYTAGSDWSLAAGVEAHRDDLESTNLGDRNEVRGAVFEELIFMLAGRGALTLGARGDFHEAFGSFFSPSMAASYDLSTVTRVRASIGRSFRSPTFTERYYRDGFHEADATIDVERSWSYEAGVEVLPARDWSVRVTGFHRRSRDLIDWAKPAGATEDLPWVTRNVDEADVAGIEIDAHAFSLLGARWTGGVTLLRLETKEEVAFFSKGALRPESRRISIGVSRRFFDRLEVGARWLHRKRIGDPSHPLLDLRLAWDTERGRLYADVDNLTDHAYLDITGRRAAGRAFTLGFSAQGGLR